MGNMNLSRQKQFLESRKEAGKKIPTMSNGVSVPEEETLKTLYHLDIVRIDIAYGAIANLYKGRLYNREVVVKVVTMDKLKATQRKNQYMEGLKILMFLKETGGHRNLITILNVFNTLHKSYVVMELAVGKNLLSIYKEGTLHLNHESVAYNWFKDVCEGVYYLHSIGVAHGKLQPAHIITSEKGSVKIAGMGEAVVYWDGEKVIPQRGSSTQKFHHFYAPERMKDKQYDPAAADIWALGTLLVTMLARKWPFDGEKSHLSYEIQWKIVFSIQELIRSELTNNVLDTCFVVNPKDRGNILMLLSTLSKNKIETEMYKSSEESEGTNG